MKRLEERRDVDLAWLAGSGRVAGEQPLGEGRRRRRKEARRSAAGTSLAPSGPAGFAGPSTSTMTIVTSIGCGHGLAAWEKREELTCMRHSKDCPRRLLRGTSSARSMAE